MSFQIGDKVVHRSFGLGEVVRLEEKRLAGQTRLYYVVTVSKLTLWVPVDGADEHSLRLVLGRREFIEALAILRGPREDLSDDRYERQTQLLKLMREGSVEGLCRVLRDLSARSCMGRKMNDNDTAMLQRARGMLLDEWQLSQGASLEVASRELDVMLEEVRVAAKKVA